MSSRATLPDLVAQALHEQAAAVVVSPAVAAERAFRARRGRRVPPAPGGGHRDGGRRGSGDCRGRRACSPITTGRRNRRARPPRS